MEYKNMSLEDCFVYYHTAKVACECDADEKLVKFMEE